MTVGESIEMIGAQMSAGAFLVVNLTATFCFKRERRLLLMNMIHEFTLLNRLRSVLLPNPRSGPVSRPDRDDQPSKQHPTQLEREAMRCDRLQHPGSVQIGDRSDYLHSTSAKNVIRALNGMT
jgi:hypothetical protein